MSAVIQFSGGKDSLALVLFMESMLHVIDVVMVDTGDMPEAAYENADIVRSLTDRFYVIKTDSKWFRAEFGDPDASDWTGCCGNNIWIPMAQYVADHGYRQVLRGSKRCDPYIHGVMPGDVVSNVLYTMPLWDWSDDDVKDYLGSRLAGAYRAGAVGMPDCLTCPVKEACGGRTRHLWREV